jgi:hypothetical protein
MDSRSIHSSTTLSTEILEDQSIKTLKQDAQADRNRLTEAMEQYQHIAEEDSQSIAHSFAQSVSVATDDYTDADEFIINKSSGSSTHSGQRNLSHDTPIRSTGHITPPISTQEHVTPPMVNRNTPLITAYPIQEQVIERPPQIKVYPSDGGSPQVSIGAASMNRRSIISDYAPSIHEVNHVAYVVDPELKTSSSSEFIHKQVVKVSRASSKNSKGSSGHVKQNSNWSNSEPESTSGSSKYPASNYSSAMPPESIQKKIIPEGRSVSTTSFDFNVGPLSTKKEGKAVETERQELTTVDPAIPSRSPRRPFSMVATNSPTPKIASASVRRAKSDDLSNIDVLVQGAESLRDVSNSSKGARPLPPPPLPKHRDSRHQTDDGFITEDEDSEQKLRAKSKKAQKKKKKISTIKKFNQDTLLQMLQLTEGTIIGQEFQNIGLEPTDKQLLERLVDSLSRLTADMIVDPERHDESVKRLNKAIRALEGF